MQATPTLLITDDDHALRESLGSIFQARGCQTLLAGDGKEACEVVQSNDVHLVLIDFHMPRMTGLEALREMKRLDQKLPVILMSAALDEEMSNELKLADAFAIHTKPLDISRIRNDVATALRTIYQWSIDW